MADLYHLWDELGEQADRQPQHPAPRNQDQRLAGGDGVEDEPHDLSGDEETTAEPMSSEGEEWAPTTRTSVSLPLRPPHQQDLPDGSSSPGASKLIPQYLGSLEDDQADDEEENTRPHWESLGEKVTTRSARLASLPYTRIQKAWIQEGQAPELLPLPAPALQEMAQALSQQEQVVEELLTTRSSSSSSAHLPALLASILRTDAERAQFYVTDLLKRRLHKLEAHPLYYHQQYARHESCADDEEEDPDQVQTLNEPEVEFLRGYKELMEAHFRRTVLDHFPQEAWKKLDEPEMVDRPDAGTYVFIRVKEEAVEIDNGTAEMPDLQRHEPGTCLIVRYHRIQSLLRQGLVELM